MSSRWTTEFGKPGLVGRAPVLARPLRLRVFVEPVHGISWLRLLALCAFARGGILAPQLERELMT